MTELLVGKEKFLFINGTRLWKNNLCGFIEKFKTFLIILLCAAQLLPQEAVNKRNYHFRIIRFSKAKRNGNLKAEKNKFKLVRERNR